jgi:integrase
VKFTPHLFRHTYATDLLRRDVPSEVVQKLLGHASVSTTIDTTNCATPTAPASSTPTFLKKSSAVSSTTNRPR